MKTYNEFTQAVADIFANEGTNYLPNDFGKITVKLQEVTKANDEHLVGLTIMKEGSNIAPTIYLEKYYDMYRNGYDMDEIIDRIAEVRVENDAPDVKPDDIFDLAKVRGQITCKLLNIRANEEYLADKPYSKISDLAAVYMVDLGRNMSVPVTYNLLERYGITKETLHRIAVKNITKYGVKFKSMKDILVEMGIYEEDVPTDPNHPMYVLTNTDGMFGANLLLDKETMQYVSEVLGGDFIILPSSIHEVIILGMEKGTDGLTTMINEVNNKEVEDRDVLSNHPYIYSAQTGKIRSVA